MILWIWLLGLAPQEEDRKVVVTVEDGSRFFAETSIEPLQVRTDYGELRIPLRDVVSVRRTEGGKHEIRTGRITVEGTLASESFSFDTDLGKLKIPTAHVLALELGHARSLFSTDDATLLFWGFDAGAPALLTEGEIARQEEGFSAFVRQSENAYVQGKLPDEFSFGSGSFTIEVRVKIGTMSRGYATLMARNDEASTHNREFWFLVQKGGQLYFDSGNATTTHFVSQTPAVLDAQRWNYVALVRDQTAGEIRYFVNGKKVHTDRRALTFHAVNGPIFLGPGAAGKSYFSCPERFQFARISNRVRTDKEMEEIQERLENGAAMLGGISGPGIFFRDGSHFRANPAPGSKIRFRTEFGTLEIAPEIAARIELYPLRESEIESLQPDIDRWIETLGDVSIEKREEAEQALRKTGAPALRLLQEAREFDDPEVRTRVEAILKDFERAGVVRRPARDRLEMGRTVLYGWLELSEMTVDLKYGSFSIDLRKIESLSLGESPEKASGPLVRLRSGETIQGDPKGSTISFETEFGVLQVPFQEVVSLQFDEAKKHWTLKTEKAVVAGKFTSETLSLETEAGPLSVPLSQVAELMR